jgi:hypothetical protein
MSATHKIHSPYYYCSKTSLDSGKKKGLGTALLHSLHMPVCALVVGLIG